MKPTALLLALLALITGLVIAGCGDDDDEPETVTGATGTTGAAGAGIETKAEWIAAADDICEQADDNFAKLAEEQYPEGPPAGEDAVNFGEDVVIPNLESQHDQISALPVPEGEEEAIAEILAELQAGIDALEEDPGSFVDTDAFDGAAAAAKDYGLKVCGQE